LGIAFWVIRLLDKRHELTDNQPTILQNPPHQATTPAIWTTVSALHLTSSPCNIALPKSMTVKDDVRTLFATVFTLPKFSRGLLIDSLWMIGFAVLNDIAVSMLDFSFAGFPSFNNYFCTALSVPIFLVIALIRKEEVLSGRSLTWMAQKQYLILAITTVISWDAIAGSAAWVDGNLQQLLANAWFVFVFILSVPMMNLRISKREVLASLVIVGGILLGSYESLKDLSGSGLAASGVQSWFNAWYFILIFIISIFFQALNSVCQEKVFRAPYHLQEASCLFWYALYCVIPFLLSIPLESLPQVNATDKGRSVAWAYENQAGAFRCFFAIPTEDEYPDRCTTKYAWLWVLLTMIGYPGYFYFNSVLFKRTNAFWTVLLHSLASPLAAVAFNFPQIVGDRNYVPFTGYVAASFLIILTGVFLRGAHETPDDDVPSYQPVYGGEIDLATIVDTDASHLSPVEDTHQHKDEMLQGLLSHAADQEVDEQHDDSSVETHV
jgi:hypothetical protein